MKRAALYARVSTSQQEEQGTIASQVTALRKRIVHDGCHLDPVHEFTDDGVSGSYLARPGLDRLRDLACERAFDVLYVLSPDRLARRYAHQCVVLDELTRWGVEVIFLNQPVTGDSPEDRLMVNVLGVLAEYERELIRDRLRRGKLYKARQGQVFAVVPAYGYCYVPVDQPGGGRWEVNESEAAVVRCLFRWCVEEQLSIQAICRRLNGEAEGFERVSPRKAQRWLPATVDTILRRPDYTGTAYYNRTRKDPNRTIGQPKNQGRGLRTANCRIERDREAWIPVAVPQIVPSTLWEQAQVQLDLNQKFARRNNKRHFYLLRGLLVCGECGRTLVGRTYASGSVRYYCTNRGTNRTLIEPCSCPPLDGDIVEPLVWRAIAELLADPQLILDYYLARQDESDTAPHELKRARQELDRIEKQSQRLLDAYQAQVIELDELATRRQALEQQRQVLESRLSELEQLAQQQARQAALASDVTEFCDNINSVLESPTPEQKQQVLRLIVDHILVGKEQLTVKHVIPLAGDRRLHIQRSQARVSALLFSFFGCYGSNTQLAEECADKNSRLIFQRILVCHVLVEHVYEGEPLTPVSRIIQSCSQPCPQPLKPLWRD
ncbi:MAG: Transposon gamma-delta resolvase [Anaerolineales bacterium]|nr:Transposon gamma-delta resolvase [Anaerolineales bacterium]